MRQELYFLFLYFLILFCFCHCASNLGVQFIAPFTCQAGMFTPQQPAKQRKRDAVGNLRGLAQELGIPTARKSDMVESEFTANSSNLIKINGKATKSIELQRTSGNFGELQGAPRTLQNNNENAGPGLGQWLLQCRL